MGRRRLSFSGGCAKNDSSGLSSRSLWSIPRRRHASIDLGESMEKLPSLPPIADATIAVESDPRGFCGRLTWKNIHDDDGNGTISCDNSFYPRVSLLPRGVAVLSCSIRPFARYPLARKQRAATLLLDGQGDKIVISCSS